MEPTLEKITQDGFKRVDTYADCDIYGKDKERLLYQRDIDKVVFKYTF